MTHGKSVDRLTVGVNIFYYDYHTFDVGNYGYLNTGMGGGSIGNWGYWVGENTLT